MIYGGAGGNGAIANPAPKANSANGVTFFTTLIPGIGPCWVVMYGGFKIMFKADLVESIYERGDSVEIMLSTSESVRIPGADLETFLKCLVGEDIINNSINDLREMLTHQKVEKEKEEYE